MSSPIELFSFEACPYAQRTRMTMIEKSLNFTLTEIDLFNRPDWFADVSPYGKVPLLRHDGVTIYESAIINQYLDETFPEPPLMPATAASRAQARIWMDYCDTRFLPATHRLMSGPADGPQHDENVRQLENVLSFIESEALARLGGGGPFFLGKKLTLVDLQFSPFFERWPSYAQLAGAVWPDSCTRLRGWFEAMQGRDSYQQTCKPVEYHVAARRQMLARIAEARAARATT
jgi:glutathione S-transferase